tara:strand:+ start:193 stop:513 length:321 start_codon:yes stop_codon:yes gene_type:complete
MKKVKIAKTIEAFLRKYDLCGDVRIYFSNRCWDYNQGIKTIIKDIKGSEYFEYANDDTISMSFEGELYDVLNMNYGYDMRNEWDKLDLDGYYAEMGNSWNLALYEK